jgi:flagellar hook assembly protein FlgD
MAATGGLHGPAAAGDHRAVWDGRRDGGRSVGSGVYVVQLIAGGDEHTQKIHLLK